MIELTKREKKVYEAIVEYIGKHGYSPTLREVGIKTGINSTSSVYYAVRNLKLKGYIDTEECKRRVITLKDNPNKVVLCKNCKYRHKTNTGLAIWMVCHKLNRQTADDFYCAYGEEKDNANQVR